MFEFFGVMTVIVAAVAVVVVVVVIVPATVMRCQILMLRFFDLLPMDSVAMMLMMPGAASVIIVIPGVMNWIPGTFMFVG